MLFIIIHLFIFYRYIFKITPNRTLYDLPFQFGFEYYGKHSIRITNAENETYLFFITKNNQTINEKNISLSCLDKSLNKYNDVHIPNCNDVQIVHHKEIIKTIIQSCSNCSSGFTIEIENVNHYGKYGYDVFGFTLFFFTFISIYIILFLKWIFNIKQISNQSLFIFWFLSFYFLINVLVNISYFCNTMKKVLLYQMSSIPNFQLYINNVIKDLLLISLILSITEFKIIKDPSDYYILNNMISCYLALVLVIDTIDISKKRVILFISDVYFCIININSILNIPGKQIIFFILLTLYLLFFDLQNDNANENETNENEKNENETNEIKNIIVPKQFKEINSFFCKTSFFIPKNELVNVEFENESKIHSICFHYFQNSNIVSIKIPPSVYYIGNLAFENCKNLKSIEFIEKAKIRNFNNFLKNSSIEYINIPSSLSSIVDNWPESVNKLNHISISDENKCFVYHNNDFLLTKSNYNSEDNDTLIFARRNIKFASIPCFIKTINSFAFNCCKLIRKIKFAKNSMLKIICKNAFNNSSIEDILIPSSVVTIEANAFYECRRLNKIEFEKNSNLLQIGKYAFSKTSIKSIQIPSKVCKIGKKAFYNCSNLINVNFLDDSNLSILKIDAFNYQSIISLSITSFDTFIPENLLAKCSNIKIIEINDKSLLAKFQKEINLFHRLTIMVHT